MASQTRIYHVPLQGKDYLVEAASKEQAVQRATAPLVGTVTIPTPLETVRLQTAGATMILASQPLPPIGEGDVERDGEGAGDDAGTFQAGPLQRESGDGDADGPAGDGDAGLKAVSIPGGEPDRFKVEGLKEAKAKRRDQK